MDSVALEMAVAQFDDSQRLDVEELWGQLDQQKLPLKVRQLLDQNGIRVAVIPSNVPAVLHRLVADKEIVPEELSDIELQMYEKGVLEPEPRLITSVHRQIAKGKSFTLNVSPQWAQARWNLKNGDQETFGSGEMVHGVFELTTFPNENGTVQIVITPKIYHGNNKTKFGVAEGDFVYQTTQDSVACKPIEFNLEISSGETLIIGPTNDLADLGRLFFAGDNSGGSRFMKAPVYVEHVDEPWLSELDELAAELSESTNETPAIEKLGTSSGRVVEREKEAQPPKETQRVLMIRVVQTQKDDLFNPRKSFGQLP